MTDRDQKQLGKTLWNIADTLRGAMNADDFRDAMPSFLFLGYLSNPGGGRVSKKILIIAGPNGAGKTTFARSFLPAEVQCPRFLNADLIAAGLSPFAPEAAAVKAGRLMLAEIDECVARGESFAFETTLAGVGYARHVRRWRGLGYHVKLFFLRLPDPETAIARVAARVRQGGHHIPEDVIRRRFAGGLRNLERAYKPVVDAWAVYDNSGEQPVLLEWSETP